MSPAGNATDWPRCPGTDDRPCVTRVRDGGRCSRCTTKLAVRGHAFDPVPADELEVPPVPEWWPCRCGAKAWEHKLWGDAQDVPAEAASDPLSDPHAYVGRDARPTSQAAAEGVLLRSGTQRHHLLRCLVQAGDRGATDDDLGALSRLDLNSVRPRRLELVEAGYVTDSGDTRPSARGNPAVVWLPTLQGLDALEAAERSAP